MFIAILARRLSVEGFGQFAYGQWLVDLAFLVCSLGATGVVGRYLAELRYDAQRSSAIVRLWFPFAIGLPALAAVLALAGSRLARLELDALAAVGMMSWAYASGLWAMQTAALIGLQRFDLICAANMLAGSLMIAGALAMPIEAAQPVGAFALMATTSAVAALVGVRQTARVAAKRSGRIDPDLLRDIRRYALNIWMTALLWSLVWSRGEMPIVHAFLGDEGVARYAAVLTLFGGAIQGVMLAVSGVAPHLTRLWGERAHVQALTLARTVMDMQLVASGIGATLLICLGPELLGLAFGPTYRAESVPMTILSVGLLAMAVSAQSHLLQIATNAAFSRNSTLAGAVLLLALALWFVAVEGLPGAAAARSTTMLVIAAVSLYVVRHKWGRGALAWRNIAATLSVVGAVVAAALWNPGMSLSLRAAVACAASILIVVAVRDEFGRMRAREVASRIRRASAVVGARSEKSPGA